MQTNPFSPPVSQPSPEPGERLWMPLFLGVCIGSGAGYIAMGLSGVGFLWWLALSGAPMADLYREAYTNVPYLLFAHAVGFACMAAGGYWTARMAPLRAYSTAAIAGVLSALFVVLEYSIPIAWPNPFWSRALSVLLPVPGYVLGAYLCRRRASGSVHDKG